MPGKWEVWLAKVKFEDDLTQIKKRPILVVSDTECCILSLKMTSHAPRTGYQGEYPLLKWEEAGLKKPSTVRTSKWLKMEQKDFVHRLGKLHPVDIIAVQKLLS